MVTILVICSPIFYFYYHVCSSGKYIASLRLKLTDILTFKTFSGCQLLDVSNELKWFKCFIRQQIETILCEHNFLCLEIHIMFTIYNTNFIQNVLDQIQIPCLNMQWGSCLAVQIQVCHVQYVDIRVGMWMNSWPNAICLRMKNSSLKTLPS